MTSIKHHFRRSHTALAGAALLGAILTLGAAATHAADTQTVEASLYSTMPSTSTHRPEMALDGDPGTYFQTTGGMVDGDDFLVMLSSPIPVKSITITTGTPDKKDLLTQGTLETSADGMTFQKAAAFSDSGIANATSLATPVEAIRIRVPHDANAASLTIREIVIDSSVKIGYVEWAPGRGFIDVSQAPDVLPWAEKAQMEVAEFWPDAGAMLYSDGFIPPNMVNMVFKDGDGVAGTGGGVMTVNAKWCRAHPEDTGLTVHEMTHVVQAYPSYSAGWLVEGIADYIRWCKFEPEHFHPRINPAKATYHDAYQTTAAFLIWCEQHYDSGLVTKLNSALRTGTYSDALFKKYTGKDPDALWAEFVQTLPARPAAKS